MSWIWDRIKCEKCKRSVRACDARIIRRREGGITRLCAKCYKQVLSWGDKDASRLSNYRGNAAKCSN